MNVTEAFQKIESELLRLQEEAGKTNGVSPLVVSKDIVLADFVSYISFTLFPHDKAQAEEKSKILVKQLEVTFSDIANVDHVKGFINFFLKDEIIRKENEKNLITIETKYKGRNILIEHSSPNLFKPFSVGHLMNNFIGEFVARATDKGGATTETMSFPSDISLGIAKAMRIVLMDKKDVHYFDSAPTEEAIKYLGEAYVRGVKECEENEGALKESKEILDRMYTNSNETDFGLLFNSIRRISEKYFKIFLQEINSSIDDFQYESLAGEYGLEVVKENTGEGKVFTESEGATVYIPDESRKDLHTSVFVNSQKYPTYEAKDLGLLEIKFKWRIPKHENFYPDCSFFVTDTEQVHHFKVVLDAASKLGGKWLEWASRSKHITHGRMLFKGQKMSSRLGGVPLALDVITAIEEEVRARAGDKIAHLSEEDKKKLEREIALSALRISVLRSKPGININFDPETSLSFEGDSGPYLLYTHARCASLIDKAKTEKGYTDKFGKTPVTIFERELSRFDLILQESINSLSPQTLVSYLFKIAQGFNSFYASTQIITDDQVMSEHNLAIVKRTKFVMWEGLYILGVNAKDRM